MYLDFWSLEVYLEWPGVVGLNKVCYKGYGEIGLL